jgi:hypothetical protein
MSVSFSNIVSTPGSATLTTKGDILVHDGTNPSRMAIGTNGYALYPNSASSNGLEWKAAPTGATSDYAPIAYTGITANTNSVSFTGIPGTYSSILLVATMRYSNDSTVSASLNVNSNTTANVFGFFQARSYESTRDGSATKNQSDITIDSSAASSSDSGNFGTFYAQIDNYANSTKYKSIFFKSSSITIDSPPDGTLRSIIGTALYRSNNSITSLSIDRIGVGSFASGSSFALYGIK